MQGSLLYQAIAELASEVTVMPADSPELRKKAYQLRYQVYVVERGFLSGQNGIERDEYDDSARHIVAIWKRTGQVVGTVRLVLAKDPPGGEDYPIQHVCDPQILRGLPRARMGEVSRFALAKSVTQGMRGIGSTACASLLRLALIQGAVRLSAEARHTHWLAVMEPTLLRLLGATGIHFTPLGQPVEYHGLRQPAVAELLPMLARLARERHAIWDFITAQGLYYPESEPRRHFPAALAAARALAA